MPSGPLNPGVDVIVAAGIVVVPVVFNCAAENTNTAVLPLSLTHRFPLPSNAACCGNTKLADEIVTAGVGAELLDRFDNCFAVNSYSAGATVPPLATVPPSITHRLPSLWNS